VRWLLTTSSLLLIGLLIATAVLWKRSYHERCGWEFGELASPSGQRGSVISRGGILSINSPIDDVGESEGRAYWEIHYGTIAAVLGLAQAGVVLIAAKRWYRARRRRLQATHQ
jgi:hypothetical protein